MTSDPRSGRKWFYRTLLLLVVLCLSGWLTWTSIFPAPATASPAAIGRWLAKRDLSRTSSATQLALVERLQQLLLVETGLAAFPPPAPDDLEQIDANVQLLSRAWFLDRSDAYQQVMLGDRMPFLRHQVDVVIAWGEFDNQLQARRRRQAGLEPENNKLHLLDDIDGWIVAEPSARHEGLRHALHDAVLCWLATSDMADQPMSMRQEAADRIALALDGGAASAADRLELNAQHRDRLLKNAWLLMEAWFRNRSVEFVSLPIMKRVPFIEDQLDNVSSWGLDRVMVISADGEQGNSRPPQARLLEVVSQLLAQFPDWIAATPEDQRDAVAHLAEELKHNLATYMLKKTLPDLLPGTP